LNMERIAGVADFERALSNLKDKKLSLVYVRNSTLITSETTL